MVFSKKWSNFALVNELDRQIEILLLDNDCVIVPNFGGFVAHHVDARYDESESSFLPPFRTLGFNPHLKNINDSLLAQSYMETFDISYPEAQRAIARDVDEIRNALAERGEVVFKNIGKILTQDTGELIFEPYDSGILTPDLYGLGAFSIAKLGSEDNESRMEAALEVTTETVAAPETTEAEEEIDNVQEYEYEDEDDSERTISIKVSWIRNIAVAAAAIIAFFIISTPVTNSSDANLYVSDIIPEVFTKITVLDTPNTPNTKAQSIKADSVIRQTAARRVAKEPSRQARAEKDSVVKKKPAYCIVLASQVTKRGAEDFVNTLKKEGYDNAYTYINNKIVRVVYGRYETEELAQKELRSVRGDKHFEQAWVYKMTTDRER